jgi:hypothetical protein
METGGDRGTRWRSWLRHCATSRKVAGSIPDGVIEIFLELILLSFKKWDGGAWTGLIWLRIGTGGGFL